MSKVEILSRSDYCRIYNDISKDNVYHIEFHGVKFYIREDHGAIVLTVSKECINELYKECSEYVREDKKL